MPPGALGGQFLVGPCQEVLATWGEDPVDAVLAQGCQHALNTLECCLGIGGEGYASSYMVGIAEWEVSYYSWAEVVGGCLGNGNLFLCCVLQALGLLDQCNL